MNRYFSLAVKWMEELPQNIHLYNFLTNLSPYHPCAWCFWRSEEGLRSPKNWSYRWLWVSLWVPGIELWSSIRTTLVLNGWSISPASVLSNLYLNAQWGRLLINSEQSKLSLNTEPKSTMWRGPSPHFDLFQAHKSWDCANEQPHLHSLFNVLLWWLLLIVSYMNEYHGEMSLKMSY